MKNTIHVGKLIASAVAVAFTLVLNAAEVALKSDLAPGFDWSQGESYVGGNVPGTGDTIVVPSGMTAMLSASDSTSFAFVSARARVTPLGRFVVDVGSGSVDFNAAISLQGKASANIGEGLFQKTGAGDICLKKYGDLSGVWDYNYDVNILVSAGRVVMPDGLPYNSNIRYAVRNLNLSSGTLKCPECGTSGKSVGLWIMGGLTGDGMLEAVSDNPAETTIFYDSPGIHGMVFSGKLSGGMSFQVKDGSIDFTGMESDISGPGNGNFNVQSDTEHTNIVGFASFNKPGPTGVSNKLFLGIGTDAYSHVSYLGEGETTSQPLNARPTVNGWNIIDGGEHGDLVLNGAINYIVKGTSSGRQSRFVFSGDHSNPCTFNGGVVNNSGGSTFYFEKRGTGTWKIGDNTVRQDRGLFAVYDGLLQYQSIAEAGSRCSFGLSTETYEYKDGSLDPAYATAYAIRLGSTNSADVACDPKIQYVGAAAAAVTTRPIGIANKGTLVSGTAAIDWTGISPVGRDDATLVLDGTDTSGANTVRGLTDNAAGGKLSVAKRGAGTWTVDGEASLSGRVSVEQGNLAFDADTGFPYKYYRLTLRETARNATRFDGKAEKTSPRASSTQRVAIQRMGLFDDDGNWICSNLVYNADYTALLPGEVAIQNPDAMAEPANAYKIANYFLTTSGAITQFDMNSAITYANTNAHLQIVMRLRDADVGKATRFNMLYVEMTTANYNWKTEPTAYTLEASADGVHWNIVEDRQLSTSEVDSAANYWWVQDHKSYGSMVGGGSFDPAERKGKGWAIASEKPAAVPHVAMLDNAEIAVASGASLTAIGGKTEISRLVVDCAGGAGTFSGITLASSGTLVLENVGDGCSYDVLTSVNGLDVAPLAGWDFTVNGAASGKYKLVVGDGVVTLKKIGGLLLFFR